jgi:hypothetical protein
MKYFTNFTFKYMKKLILSLALVAFIMLGTMSAAKSMTVTFYVKITLTDNCFPTGYNGYYCVRLNLTYNGTVLCTAQNCNVRAGTYCYAFTCDIDAIAEEHEYGVDLVGAYRTPGGLCSSTTGTGSNSLSWDQMTDTNCVATLSVAL